MSRYSNVETLLDMAENYDNNKLVRMIAAADDYETLAEDIAFVIISLWGMVPAYLQQAFKNRLTDEIVNVEIQEMFDDD